MASEPQNPDDVLKALGEKFQKVTFGGGVVGRTTQVVLAVIGIWLVALWRLSANIGLDLLLMGAAAIVTAFGVWWVKGTHRFAEKNPLQAMLSGSQFIEYHRFTAQAKGLTGPNDTPLISASNVATISTVDPKKDDVP